MTMVARPLTILMLGTLGLTPCTFGQSESNLQSELEGAWTELLSVWYPRAIDSTHGGYLANFEYDWTPSPTQDKMIVTQARHLWTTSKAAELYPDQPFYRQAARHGFEFLRDRMWDAEHGGFYWKVNRAGEPLLGDPTDRRMSTYGNSFGLYALAAYHHAVGDDESLEMAQRTFQWLDQHAHDTIHGGYFAALTEYGKVIDRAWAKQHQVSPQFYYKDQNTSIHLLEAFTELYQVWPDSLVRSRLQEMLTLVRDTMVSDIGYLRLFFQPDWTPVSYQDSARTVREANYGLDHVSFGHDIETAFLILEASEVLYGEADEKTKTVAKKLVDHTLKYGFDPVVSGIYDRGYYLPDTDTVTIIDDHKAWWSQAEGLNTLSMYAQFFPEDPRYQKAFDKLWQYTKTYIIDAEHGGWYVNGLDTHPEVRHLPKGQAWKGNYHNGRTLMRLLKRKSEK